VAEPSVHTVIVDDDPKEGEVLTDLLNQAGGDELQVDLLPPKSHVEETAAEIFNLLSGDNPKLLLLDYRLEDHPIEGDGHVPFRGGTVAGFVRDKDPDLPIALLTSEEKLHDWVERRAGVKEFFNWTLIKKKVTEPGGAARVSAQMIDYARSWEQARGWEDETNSMWGHMEELMRAPEGEISLFKDLEGEPPRGDVAGEVMHWLLYRALRIPGPLIGTATTRVTLGLTPESFAKDKVIEWLDDAAYTGALRAFHDRWWGQLVRAKLTTAAGGTRPLDASTRAAVLGEKLGEELEHEGCSWCGGERTLQACHICERATDAAHSLRPLAEALPAWADAWVVCYRCIAEGQADTVTFPQSVHDVVQALTEGRVREPKE
jgi:CheY-like chemotaxis protein